MTKYTKAGKRAGKRGLLDILEIALLHRNGRLSTRDAKCELHRFLFGTMSDSLRKTDGATDENRKWAMQRVKELHAIMIMRPVGEWPYMMMQIADRLGVEWCLGGPRVKRQVSCVACHRSLTLWSPILGTDGADPMPDLSAIVCPDCEIEASEKGVN